MSNPTIYVGSTPVTFYYGDDHLGGSCITERVGETGPEAIVNLKCAYSKRLLVAQTLIGTAIWNGFQVVRTNPFQYPPSPNMYCMEIAGITGLKPKLDNFGWQSYTYAVLSAVFRRPPYPFVNVTPGNTQEDPSGMPYTTTRFQASPERIPTTTQYIWNGGQSTIGPPGAKVLGAIVPQGTISAIHGQVEVTMTRHFMPYVPLNFFLQYQNNINLNPVSISDHTFPKGTLMLLNLASEPLADPSGNYIQNLTYVMLGKNQDWNLFQDPNGAQTMVSTAVGGGSTPYTYSDWYTNLP